MDRLYLSNVSGTAPPVPYPGTYGFVQGSDSLPQFAPTNPGAFWFYFITESMRNVIVGAGLTPDAHDLTQFARAIEILAAS